ncbi:MAG: hypothetical protein SH857_13600 [Chitinophagales bacterium]|nr:hypothetical protein [Chitinophagales bacterium]
MMKHSLLAMLFVFAILSAHAQFSAEKYFTDTVAFAFQRCSVSVVKKKEIKTCVPYTYTVQLINDEFIITEFVESSVKNSPQDNSYTDQIVTYAGRLVDMNTVDMAVKKFTGFGKQTIPAEIYGLIIWSDNYGLPFTSQSELLGKNTTLGVYLYFASESDAYSARAYLIKKFLEAKNR